MKNLQLFIAFIIMSISLSGCVFDKEKPGILFNKDPISKDTVMNSSRHFEVGKPIYYLFYTPKKIETEFIRVQVFKVGDNIPRGGYKIVWTNEYRIMKQNMYYYYNYFVLHSPGSYVMQIFSMDDLMNPLVKNFFYVH